MKYLGRIYYSIINYVNINEKRRLAAASHFDCTVKYPG